jgi:hypothetical protein
MLTRDRYIRESKRQTSDDTGCTFINCLQPAAFCIGAFSMHDEEEINARGAYLVRIWHLFIYTY